MTMGESIKRHLWRLASEKIAAFETAAEGLTAGPTELERELETAAKRPEDADPEPRLMRFKSARISAADWVRRSGSFSSDFRITSLRADGSCGFRSTGGNGFFSRIAWKITAEVG